MSKWGDDVKKEYAATSKYDALAKLLASLELQTSTYLEVASKQMGETQFTEAVEVLTSGLNGLVKSIEAKGRTIALRKAVDSLKGRSAGGIKLDGFNMRKP